jgi:hypothetical protein
MRKRKFLAFLAAMLLILAFGCSRNDQRAGTIRIDRKEIDFPGMQLRPGKDRTTFKLVGRIRNKSSRSIVTGVTFRFTMEDVLATGASTTVAETIVALHCEVPPLDSRDMAEDVLFKTLPQPRGRHEWNYAVLEVAGK